MLNEFKGKKSDLNTLKNLHQSFYGIVVELFTWNHEKSMEKCVMEWR